MFSSSPVMAAPTSQKADKETYVETLIKRFKAGDPEVVYEKIQVNIFM